MRMVEYTPVGDAQTFSYYPSWPVPLGIRLNTSSEHDCSYFPARPARTRGFLVNDLAPGAYRQLMDAGFRRSGRIVYQPMCRGCRLCVPLRIHTTTFTESKSQRRVSRLNADITCTPAANTASDEKFEVYSRYIAQWHGSTQAEQSRNQFEEFLYDSPTDSLDFEYRDAAGKLLAVGVCDRGEGFLSSVYFYFDPAERSRSLGTLGAVLEIEWSARNGIDYYYLGYWIDGCQKMAYKNAFGPHEVLNGDGVWRTPTAVTPS